MTKTLRIMDLVTRTALIGMRFWDEAAREPIRDGLRVELRSLFYPFRRVPAIANSKGVHVLHSAPGLMRCVFGAGDDAFWQDPPDNLEMVAEVTDQNGCFLPLEMTARLPQKGFFLPDCLVESTPVAEGFIPLFSTPVRPVPGGMAVVRCELHNASDDTPASWALITVMLKQQYGDVLLGRGVADREGRAAVIFPYPEPEIRKSATSPPQITIAPGWDITLSAYHDVDMNGTERPELCRLLKQSRVRLLDSVSPPAEIGPVYLRLGCELIVRSVTSPFVYVAPLP